MTRFVQQEDGGAVVACRWSIQRKSTPQKPHDSAVI